jgi:hypothetical protein
MKIDEVRADYQKQLKEVEVELAKLKEYKIKLLGGLETLDFLDAKEEEEKTGSVDLPVDLNS